MTRAELRPLGYFFTCAALFLITGGTSLAADTASSAIEPTANSSVISLKEKIPGKNQLRYFKIKDDYYKIGYTLISWLVRDDDEALKNAKEDIRVVLPPLNSSSAVIALKSRPNKPLPSSKFKSKIGKQKSDVAPHEFRDTYDFTISSLVLSDIEKERWAKEDIRVYLPVLNASQSATILKAPIKTAKKEKQDKRPKLTLEQKLFPTGRVERYMPKDPFTDIINSDESTIADNIATDPMFYQENALPMPDSYVIDNDVSVTIADAFNHRIIEIDPHPQGLLWDYGRIGTYSINSGYLHYPSYVEKIGAGLFLITDLGNNRIIKLKKGDDGFGEVLWQYGNGETGKEANQVFLAETATELPSGNILITDTSNHRIIEVDKAKDVVWQYGNYDRGTGHNWLDSPQGSGLTANPNNILIADTGNHRIIIVDKATKNIVWMYGTTASAGATYNKLNLPNAAREIFGGNILITDSANHRVMEIDRKSKKILWQYGKGYPGSGFNELNWPYNAYRLPNGNTLITDSDNQRVIEVDRYHRIVWQYGQTGVIGSAEGLLYAPYDAQITTKDYNYSLIAANNGAITDTIQTASSSELYDYLRYNPAKEIKKPWFLSNLLSIRLDYDYGEHYFEKMESSYLDLDLDEMGKTPPLYSDYLNIVLSDMQFFDYFGDYEQEINSWLYTDTISGYVNNHRKPTFFLSSIRAPILANNKKIKYKGAIENIDSFSIWDSSDMLDRYLIENYIEMHIGDSEITLNKMYQQTVLRPIDTEVAYGAYPLSFYAISYGIRSFVHVNIEPLKLLAAEYSQTFKPYKFSVKESYGKSK